MVHLNLVEVMGDDDKILSVSLYSWSGKAAQIIIAWSPSAGLVIAQKHTSENNNKI